MICGVCDGFGLLLLKFQSRLWKNGRRHVSRVANPSVIRACCARAKKRPSTPYPPRRFDLIGWRVPVRSRSRRQHNLSKLDWSLLSSRSPVESASTRARALRLLLAAACPCPLRPVLSLTPFPPPLASRIPTGSTGTGEQLQSKWILLLRPLRRHQRGLQGARSFSPSHIPSPHHI